MDFTLSLLRKYNPWWGNSESIEDDAKVVDFEHNAIKYIPEFVLNRFEPGVYTLLGPRQVGKSTALKLLIRRLLLENRVDPRSIFFFQCDPIEDYRELSSLLETYLGNVEHSVQPYVILDEVSFVRDWPRAIKHLIDRGDLKDTIVILSGSLSLRIKGGAELMPGRRGKAAKLDWNLLPISFGTYVSLLGERQSPSFEFAQILSASPESLVKNPSFDPFLIRSEFFQALVEEYLLSGGFLTSINEFKKEGKISDATYQSYWQWIEGDLLKVDRKPALFLEVMQEVGKHLGSTMSYNDIAKQTSLHSHVTAMEYLALAEKLFILNIFHNMDLQKRLPALRKQKKAAFSDPFLFHLVNGQIRGSIGYFETAREEIAARRPALIEGMVCAFLKEKFMRSGFWKNGAEVDFVGLEKKRTIGFEVKFQDRIDEKSIARLRKLSQFDRVIVVSKNQLAAVGDILVMPHWLLFLAS